MEFKATADKITKEWVLIQKHPEDRAPRLSSVMGLWGQTVPKRGPRGSQHSGAGRGVVW